MGGLGAWGEVACDRGAPPGRSERWGFGAMSGPAQPRRCSMRVSRLPLQRLVSLGLLAALVSILGAPPTPGSAQDSKTQKLVFASAGFDESNRFWTIARPDHLQYDPFLETLARSRPQDRRVHPAPGREVVGQPRLQGMDVLSAQGCPVPLRVRSVHSEGRRAFPLLHAAPRNDGDPGPVLAQRRGSEDHQRPSGRVPHEAPVHDHALCGVPGR